MPYLWMHMVDLTDLKQSRSGLRTRSAANLFQRTTVMRKNEY